MSTHAIRAVYVCGVLLFSATVLASEPSSRGYEVPGRNPNSEMPWEFFLGHAAHRLISYMYGVEHPQNRVFYNTKTLDAILEEARLGDKYRLSRAERQLRPDITDTTVFYVFEIKPWNEQGLLEGRREVTLYLSLLNRAVAPGMSFWAGTEFHGEVLIRFARGQFIWRLLWRTQEPGVIQYRWTRSQQRFESEAAAYEAGEWVVLSEHEMRQYGGWVGQAVDGMLDRREQLATFGGAVGIVIEVVGAAATGFFSTAVLGGRGTGSGGQRPPNGQGGQVIPFPSRPAPGMAPAPMPAAASMPLPR